MNTNIIKEGLKKRLDQTVDVVESIVHGKLGSIPRGEKGKVGKKATSQPQK